ncbi:hypothetical protein [Actinoplanes utahensis]|uniref:hypothetical protein n=1 Tax=Actinoplanes utahensis TaxID=1869 RepID=UPI003612C3CB
MIREPGRFSAVGVTVTVTPIRTPHRGGPPVTLEPLPDEAELTAIRRPAPPGPP